MDATYDFIERLSTKEPVPGGGGARCTYGCDGGGTLLDGGQPHIGQEKVC